VRRAWRVLDGFGQDDCAFLAGAIAYQIFFALIPLLALVVGILGFVYGSERAQRELVQLIREVYPSATAQETRIARQLVDGRALSLSFGVLGTLFSVLAIHGSLESALAAVLGREGRRTFVRGRLEAAAFIAALVGLAVLSFGVSYGVQALSGMLTAAGYRDQVRLGLQILSPIVGLAIGYVFFFLVYRVLPRRRPPARAASRAALVSAVLWEVAKLAFAYFTRALGVFAVYGPLAFAAGLLTWIYVTAVIILIGAEVMKTRGAA
jgi:YihY family inner membrane protein